MCIHHYFSTKRINYTVTKNLASWLEYESEFEFSRHRIRTSLWFEKSPSQSFKIGYTLSAGEPLILEPREWSRIFDISFEKWFYLITEKCKHISRCLIVKREIKIIEIALFEVLPFLKNHFLLSLTKLLISEKMIELGYWKIRGLVGGARVMLEHAGAGTDS